MTETDPHRQPEGIHPFMFLGHLNNELKMAMAYAYSEEQTKLIQEKVNLLIDHDVQISAIRSNVEHWQMVNGVTTESMTFTLNYAMVVKYLDSKECLRSGEADPTPAA